MNTHEIFGAIIWLIIVYGAGWIGSQSQPDLRYNEEVSVPTWNPSASILRVVWLVVYLLMAAAAWLVWRQHGLVNSLVPLGLFVAQLLLHALWPWLIYGFRRIDLALIDMIAAWVILLVAIIAFWIQLPLAGALLLPVLAWVSFDLALNYTTWQMNRTKAAA